MPYPIFVGTAFLFALAKFGVAGLLYSVASRLRGLSLLGGGFVALGVQGLVSLTPMTRVLTGGGSGRSIAGLLSFFSTLQFDLDLVAWSLLLAGAAMVAGELRTRGFAARG